MKKTLLFVFVVLIAGIVLLTTPAYGKHLKNPNLSYTCSDVSSEGLSQEGKCSELSVQTPLGMPTPFFSVAEQALINQYQELLAKVKIPVSEQKCQQKPGLILYGYYDRIDNMMVICKDVMKQSNDYVETLVHETWHAVQDCIDGLENDDITAFLTKDSKLLTIILDGLSPGEVDNILHNYEKVDQAYEVEAFFLQKYPNLVLKGLNTCVNKITSG